MKVDVEGQIRSYPKPIPRCDAQFNYLYEQRGAVTNAIERLAAAIDRGASDAHLRDELLDVLSSPVWDGEGAVCALRARLHDNTGQALERDTSRAG